MSGQYAALGSLPPSSTQLPGAGMQPGMLVSSGMDYGMMQGAMQGMGQPGEVVSS